MGEKQKTTLGPTGETLRENVRRLREDQRLTYVELSDRLSAAGRPIPVLGLRRIERGERRVDADDLVALAVVLGVNPSTLLLPYTVEGDTEITGAGTVPARAAWGWADGENPVQLPADDDGTALVDFTRAARPPGLRSWQDRNPLLDFTVNAEKMGAALSEAISNVPREELVRILLESRAGSKGASAQQD
jgi:transcriptional regulator with XRE-family HTH domain